MILHAKKTPPSTGAPYFWRWTELKPLQFVHHVQAPISPTETKKRFKTAYQYTKINLILHLSSSQKSMASFFWMWKIKAKIKEKKWENLSNFPSSEIGFDVKINPRTDLRLRFCSFGCLAMARRWFFSNGASNTEGWQSAQKKRQRAKNMFVLKFVDVLSL